MKRFFVSILLIILVGVGTNVASAQSSGLPDIPKGVGAPHPEGNAFWRINHMDLLSHDRNLTMREGNREVQASLKECVACHGVDDELGEPVGYDSPEYFCRTCHDYVAVKIDCFACHQSKPDANVLAEVLQRGPLDVSMIDTTLSLKNYLNSLDNAQTQPLREVFQ